MEYRLEKSYCNNEKLRHSFNLLAKEIYNLDFENWYVNGFWGEKYNPYSVIVNNMVVANVSVNIMDFGFKNMRKQYLQLGTVMTKKEYRNRGYIRIIMEQIKRDYPDCAGAFLWANDSVIDFYSKFGYEKCSEYRYRKSISITEKANVEKVSMENADNWECFLEEKNKRKSNSLVELDNDGLLMFYLSQFMQKSVYHIKDMDAYVVAEIEDNRLILYDIYSRDLLDINKICHAFGDQINEVKLTFTPKNSFGFTQYEYKKANSTFFVLGEDLKEDMGEILSFSELSHA